MANYSAKHYSLKAAASSLSAETAKDKVLECQKIIEQLYQNIQTYMSTFERVIKDDTKEWVVIETSIPESAFKNKTQLKKIWIPSTCTTIKTTTYLTAPFYGCSSDLQIFTDVASENNIPIGWDNFWNYYSSTGKLTVNYNSSMTDFSNYSV